MSDSLACGLKPGKLIIGGERVASISGATIDVEGPATGKILTTMPAGGKDDVDAAVAAARQSFESGVWRNKKHTAKAELLWRLTDRIAAELEDLARLETLDTGMPLSLARAMINGAVTGIRYNAGALSNVFGQTAEVSGDGLEFHAFTTKEPLGVAALISPWNGPFVTAAMKLAPALAAGCSAVIKPSERASLTTIRLGELALEAGIPEGVVNVVTGYGHEAGAALADHPDVDKIHFTGSTAVGKSLVHASTGNLKRVSLELGGKSPVFIFDDADLDVAIPAAAMGIFRNCGQVCFAGSRIYVQAGVYDRVVEGIVAFANKIRIGDGLDPASELGPLICGSQRERVLSYIESGVAEGAKVAAGGRAVPRPGHFIHPTVMVDVHEDMKMMREEIFGPVVGISRFSGLEDVARLGNNTPYGLGAGVYTQNLSVAHRSVKLLRSGTVWVNCHGFMDRSLPFGGYKQSGWGREGGIGGIEAFLEEKTVYAKL